MSIRLVRWVLDDCPVRGASRRAVLLALAERADDERGVCWPGLKDIARRAFGPAQRAGRDRDVRNTRRVLRDLAAAGELVKVGGGHGRGDTTTYIIVGGRSHETVRAVARELETGRCKADSTTPLSATSLNRKADSTTPLTPIGKGGHPRPKGGQSGHDKADIQGSKGGQPDPPNHKEPSVEPSSSPGSAAACAPMPETEPSPACDPAVVAALRDACVTEPTRSELAAMGGVTVESIREKADQCRRRGKGIGVLVCELRAIGDRHAMAERRAEAARRADKQREAADARARRQENNAAAASNAWADQQPDDAIRSLFARLCSELPKADRKIPLLLRDPDTPAADIRAQWALLLYRRFGANGSAATAPLRAGVQGV